MAKKKETLTPEEKLAQALVPKDQQPYELPKGWVWTRAKGIANVIMGQSPKGTETTDDSSQTPLIGGAADLDNLFPRPQKYTRQITKLSQPGDIIVCIRATLGKPVFSDKIYCLGRGVAAFRPLNIDKQYLRYYIINFEKYLYENATGSTFLSISSAQLANMPIPLPSLPEQQRIVARIESLFAKLDAAREKLQKVLDTQEARRAAILHEAFTGRLTGHGSEERRGKREEDSLSHLDEVEFVPEGWRKVKLSDVCTVNPPKIKTKGLDDSLEVSFYPMASVDEHTGTVTKPEKRTLGEVKRGYTNFIENDVVLAKITPCFENGKSAIIGPLLNHIGYGTTEFFVLRSAKDLYNKFLFYLVPEQLDNRECQKIL